MARQIIYILLLWPIFGFGQGSLEPEKDSLEGKYIIVKGDSIPRKAIDLEEVMILHKLKFDDKLARRRYLILRRKTIKVFPYAKLAAERLETLTQRLADIENKREKKRYTKIIQKYIEEEFTEELKNLTKTEGQILVKLIHRQTGVTTFDLVKDLRSGWRAFWYNSTANVFNISLKETFDPENDKEDYLIEDILQRNFQNGTLEYQKSALEFDFYELTNKWLANK
ncbi:DUF4294 domain-containing protein [Mangrovimonas yunxiaonensis]|uniref:DUF4294 domain-containing protein n=1 Tax=Mangrovimonas yunxiaonensis TaxID=1197477 RepID=UPI00056A1F3C|nr:DUF4294 domain-containing protein [Algicola sp.]